VESVKPFILYHVHDPMCSWCWGYRRVWDQLRVALPSSVTVVNVVGGLAPDTDEPMPLEQQHTIAGYWHKIAEQTGAEFNFDFWEKCQPRRSTYPACRAVLAAREQQTEQAMIDAIQRAYYLRAMNPSNNSTLVTLAVELGLNVERFSQELAGQKIRAALQQDFALRRKIGAYSFPSLVLARVDELIPIAVDYQTHQTTLNAIRHQLRGIKNN
jgi:putative protein-disulfide isomerase